MQYAGIIYDDTAAAPGLCLSFYTQGCPIQCAGCQNPQTWDENGGHEFTTETMEHILKGLTKNNLQRSFAILGGEPLSPHNLFLTAMIVKNVREHFPHIPIWVWSGYELEVILAQASNAHMNIILQNINALVTGPFILEKRDITLPYRGSTNQKVFLFDTNKKIWYNKENENEEYKLDV